MSRSDFWSRRRAQVAKEEAAAAEAERKATEDARAAEIAEKPDAEILAEHDLPDPDMLQPGDDISGFLQKTVPERLRQRALRRLWRMNPVLANLDGLNDYDGDFTNAATDAPGVATAYRVGKGLLRHIEAVEAARTADAPQDRAAVAPADAAATPGASVAERTDPFPARKAQETEGESPQSTTKVLVEETPDPPETDSDSAQAPTPRRMRFKFEADT